jgi:hypothetical protein
MELLNLTYCLLYKSKRQFECFTEEEFEDTKMLIRIRRSKKDRQYNGQEKEDKHRVFPKYSLSRGIVVVIIW